MYHINIPASLLMLLSWLSDNADALMNASQLLGGVRAARRTARLLDDLRRQPALNTRVRRELRALRDLLTLEHVDDPNREDGAFFAQIDPADPIVYDLCMLQEGLDEHLGALPKPGATLPDASRRAA